MREYAEELEAVFKSLLEIREVYLHYSGTSEQGTL